MELLRRLLGKRGQRPVARQQRVDGRHGRLPRVGDNAQAVAGGSPLSRQQLGAVQDVVDLRNSDDSRPLKRRVIDRVLAGHHPGVGGRRVGRQRLGADAVESLLNIAHSGSTKRSRPCKTAH